MGQKVNPIGLRLGINRTWDSRWYAGKNEYGQLLHEDIKIREELMKELKQAAVSQDRDRAAAQEVPRDHPVGAARRGDRQEGRRHREAAQEGRRAHQFRRGHQHRRDQEARARRPAGRRIDRAAARAPRRVPPRHEARGAVGHAAWCRRHPHQLLGPPRRRRDRAHGMVPRRPRAAAYAARRRRLRRRHRASPPTAPAASRSGSSRARSWSTTRWRRTRRWPKAMSGARAATRPEAIGRNRIEKGE